MNDLFILLCSTSINSNVMTRRTLLLTEIHFLAVRQSLPQNLWDWNVWGSIVPQVGKHYFQKYFQTTMCWQGLNFCNLSAISAWLANFCSRLEVGPTQAKLRLYKCSCFKYRSRILGRVQTIDGWTCVVPIDNALAINFRNIMIQFHELSHLASADLLQKLSTTVELRRC